MLYNVVNKKHVKEIYTDQYELESADGNRIYLTTKELKDRVKNGIIELKNYKLQNDKLFKLFDEDLTNKRFGNWIVLDYAGDSKWKCECQCKDRTIRCVPTSALKSGKSTGCSKCAADRRRDDLTGKIFGDWKVLEYVGNKSYKCECQCENKTIKIIQAQTLRDGRSKSCGHDSSTLRDIENQQFGLWKVIEYEGNGMWKCECQCENKTIRSIYGGSLRAGRTTSCGCNKNTKRLDTLQDKYNEKSTLRASTPRESWQIKALESKENLIKYIETLNFKPNIIELSKLLNVSYSTVHRIIDADLIKYININDFSSAKENELYNFIKELIPDVEILRNSRKIIAPHELDIYIPSKGIALEFNGNYWHSTVNKSKYYHQDKTLACMNVGIKLIHIFEYEWDNENTKEKIKAYIRDLLIDTDIIYARKTKVVEASNSEVGAFLEQNHLQGKLNSNINLALNYKNEIVGVLTVGKPRFNTEYDYEIHRLCFKSGVKVVGGFSKLLSYFINNYNITNNTKIISYINIAKFTGESYIKNGFRLVSNTKYITEPNYIWYNPKDKNILTRYVTQKHNLVEKNLGTEDETEDIIMERLGYLKIYDSGNLKLEYIGG